MSEILEASERAAEDWAADNIRGNIFRCSGCGHLAHLSAAVPSGPSPCALCEACADGPTTYSRRTMTAGDWFWGYHDTERRLHVLAHHQALGGPREAVCGAVFEHWEEAEGDLRGTGCVACLSSAHEVDPLWHALAGPTAEIVYSEGDKAVGRRHRLETSSQTFTVADPDAPPNDTGEMWRRSAGFVVAKRLRERADEIQRDSLAVSAVNELWAMADELDNG